MSIKIVKGSYSTILESASLSGDQTVTLPDASGTLTLSSQLATVATSGSYNDLSGKPTLAKVATSGSYNDLSNKPSIPSTPQGYITQTWRSGNNWYRVYSDGWIEQGGWFARASSYTSTKTWVTYHKSYSSGIVGIVIGTTKNTNKGYGGMGIFDYNTTQFSSMTNTLENTGAFWYAYGI